MFCLGNFLDAAFRHSAFHFVKLRAKPLVMKNHPNKACSVLYRECKNDDFMLKMLCEVGTRLNPERVPDPGVGLPPLLAVDLLQVEEEEARADGGQRLGRGGRGVPHLSDDRDG